MESDLFDISNQDNTGHIQTLPSNQQQNISKQDNKINIIKCFKISTLVYVVVLIISNISYVHTNYYYLQKDHQVQLQSILAQIFKKGCGNQTITKMTINSYLQLGICTIFYSSYVFTLLRRKILRRTSMPVQDYYTLNYRGNLNAVLVAKVLIRLLVAVIPTMVFTIPFILYKIEIIPHQEEPGDSAFEFAAISLGYQLALSNIPIILGSLYLLTAYDKCVFWCQDILSLNDEFE